MKISLSEHIKTLRLKSGKTQEDLAQAVGVTAQAVSRWETGICYPDLELIPSIANYFGISIDELFGYNSERAEMVDTLIAEIEKKNRLNNGTDVCIDECIRLARNGLFEFPNNEKLMLCLASLLYNAGYAKYGEYHLTDENGYDIFDVQRHKTYNEWQEAITLYEKLLTTLSDGDMRHQARRELIQLYGNMGETEKAELLACGAPDINNCRELLMLNAFDGKKCAEEYTKALVKTVSLCAELMVSTVMTKKSNISPEEAAQTVKNAIGLFDLAMEKGEYGEYNGQICRLNLYLSGHLWRSGDRDGAFAALQSALNFAVKLYEICKSSEGKQFVNELPALWPWWSVPNFTDVEKEIKADPRWAEWEKKCCSF